MKKWTVASLPDEAMPDLDDLTGDLRLLADMVGVRNALEIAEFFGGTPAQFYNYRKFILRWRDQKIREEYDAGGVTVVELARRHDLSDRQVYNILGQEPCEDRQLKLF